eukprot:3183631-Rhodomonas_salina.1
MTLDERELTLTVRAHALIFEACTWNWTSVLAKANTLGFAYFILQVPHPLPALLPILAVC